MSALVVSVGAWRDARMKPLTTGVGCAERSEDTTQGRGLERRWVCASLDPTYTGGPLTISLGPLEREGSRCEELRCRAGTSRGAAYEETLRALAKLVKNSSASFLAVLSMRRLPSWAILPPTWASTS